MSDAAGQYGRSADEEFAERLLKGSVKKSYAPGRRYRLGCAAGSGQVLPPAEGCDARTEHRSGMR